MDSDDKYREYAKRVTVFQGLRPEEVKEILHLGHTIEFFKGTTIFHQGQRGDNLFILLKGRVAIYDKDAIIAVCRVGDVFGEMSVLDHEPHSASAVAVSDVKVFTLDERQLNQIFEKRVAVRFLMNIIHVLSGYVRCTNMLNAKLRHGEELAPSSQKKHSG